MSLGKGSLNMAGDLAVKHSSMKWDVLEKEGVEAIAILQEVAEEEGTELKILDVGAHSRPFVFATHVLDIQPWLTRRVDSFIPIEAGVGAERFSEETWTEHDICIVPWPYEDDEFDVVWCTHTIEDVRDPVVVLKEMSRVARAGYLATVHRNYESQWDINGDHFVGYVHHRWLIEKAPDEKNLLFTFKTPLLHKPDKEYTPFQTGQLELTTWWQGHISGYEHIPLSLQAIEDDLRLHQEWARQVTGRIHD